MRPLLAGVAVTALILALGRPVPAPRRPGGTSSRTGGAARVVALTTDAIERAQPRRRRRRRDEQLPDALDRLASALRAGSAIGPALGALAAQVDEPLRHDLQPVARAVDRGEPVAAALRCWAEGPAASADVRLVAAALSLGADAGGEVARAVDRVAGTLRERRELQAEVRALATQARASAGVLAVAPIAFTGLVTTIEPPAGAFLFTTPVGVGCLVGGIALEAAGASWMARITRTTW